MTPGSAAFLVAAGLVAALVGLAGGITSWTLPPRVPATTDDGPAPF